MFWINSFIQNVKMNKKNQIYPSERSNNIIVKLRDIYVDDIDDVPCFKTKRKKRSYVNYLGLIQRRSRWR